MSAAPSAKQAGTATKASVPLKPVEILPTQISFFAANLQPVILISLLLISFRSLVRDPASTLLGLAPTLAVIQSAYCVLSLPSTGQALPPAVKGNAGKKKVAGKGQQDLGAKVVPALLSLLLTLFLSTPALYITVMLFGAPLTTHTTETLLLALHLALLTTPQLFYAHGLKAETWLRIASLQLPVDEGYGMTLGACAGAWLGAIPIPLDWDRDWQRWPVTIVVGIYIGAVLGKLIGGYLLKGKVMRIT